MVGMKPPESGPGVGSGRDGFKQEMGRTSIVCYNLSMSSGETAHSAWARQQKEIERIREEQPSLLERDRRMDPDIVLAEVGISGLDEDRPSGYVHYHPHDTILEERQKGGGISRPEQYRSVPDDHATRNKILHAHLTKVDLSTQEALARVRDSLGLSGEMRYAHAKSRRGQTSQRVSFEGVDWREIEGQEIPGVVLEPIAYEDHHVMREDHVGDRFTMLVRHDGSEHPERLKYLSDLYERYGFLNFVPQHQFGSRGLAHKLGCQLARGDETDCLRTFLTHPGKNDLPLFRGLRERLAANFGDWESMLEITELLPHSFVTERQVLRALSENPKKTRQALYVIRPQVQRWARAYVNWLINRSLTQGSRFEKILPERLSHDPQNSFYEDLRSQDGVADAKKAFRRLGLKPFSGERQSRVRPDIHRITQIDQGTILQFSLPTRSDPHSLLSHFYRLHSGSPVPGWVKGGRVDVLRFQLKS